MKRKPTVLLDLQYFAEGGEPSGAGSGEPAPAPTFDEMLAGNKDFQSEFDKRVAKSQKTALENAKIEWEKEAEAKAAEAAKLAKMTADEKAKHELEKQQKSLAEREAAVTKRELTAEAKSQLIERGIDPALSEFLNYADAESCKSSIDTLEKAFKEAVQKATNEALRSKEPPKVGTGAAGYSASVGREVSGGVLI